MYYGFMDLCKDYLGRHPGYYIAPLKINSSAVETLFSQFKFNAGGKLTSQNNTTSKRSVMMRRGIHGHHSSAGGYRDAPLYTQELPLRRGKSKRGLYFSPND